MPRRAKFTTQGAKNFLFKYGYVTDKDFTYTNLNKPIHLHDLTTNRNITLTMKQILYRVNDSPYRRPEYETFELDRIMNIGYQPGREALDHDAREMLFNIQPQPGHVQDDDRALNSNPATLQFINRLNDDEANNLKTSIKQQLPQWKP